VIVNGRHGLLNKAGDIVFKCEEGDYWLSNFSEGIALVGGFLKIYASDCMHDVESCGGAGCFDEPCSCDASKSGNPGTDGKFTA
jgi:hypothetical protein